MRESKRRITLLKTKINEKLGDEQDLYGFPGISKELIIQVLSDCYTILSVLDNYDSKFEAILLERETASFYSKASNILEHDFSANYDVFNDLLNLISNLHFRIKETYISVAESPIRTETELVVAREELESTVESLKEILPFKDSLLLITNEANSVTEKLNEKLDKLTERESKISTDYETIENLKNAAELSAGKIPNWEENISSLKEDMSSKQIEYAQLKKRIELLNSENEKIVEKNKELVTQYENQIIQNTVFQNQIQATIEDSNRHGMAGSFKKRKDELKLSLILWGGATIVSILILILLSYKVLFEINSDFKLENILARLPIFAACVWLGWFCAKQYGFTSRIVEDYAYKYAVSMAFEGYKNSTKEIDLELQLKLLEMTIYNISNNPLNIFESETNHGTPYHEFMKNLPKNFSIKKTVQNIATETKVENSN